MKNLVAIATERKARVEKAVSLRTFAARLEAKGLLKQALADYEAAGAACPNSAELAQDLARLRANGGRTEIALMEIR